MERLYDKECDVKTLSPLTLAFIGDRVFDLFVRERLVTAHNRPVGALHRLAVERVRCGAQAQAAALVAPPAFRRGAGRLQTRAQRPHLPTRPRTRARPTTTPPPGWRRSLATST